MTKLEAYCWLTHNRPGDLAWIANVFLTSGGKHVAANLKALVTLARQGVEVASLPFTMPYDRLLVDGRAVTPEEMCKIAALPDPE